MQGTPEQRFFLYHAGSSRDVEKAAELARQARLKLHTHNDADRKVA